MDKILGVIGAGAAHLVGHHDDDLADRLSHCHTSSLLIVFAIVVSTKQFVGEAINCWVPAHFTGNHEEYTNNYCWVRNTYYLPFTDRVPVDDLESSRRMVSYYQWVPLLLLVQALLFHLPITVWRTLCGRSGMYVRNLVDCGRTLIDTDLSHSRDMMLRYMTRQMDRFLSSLRARNRYQTVNPSPCLTACTCYGRRRCACCCGGRRGNYLLGVYLGVKLLFLVNSVSQLFLLNIFLGHDYHLFGIDFIRAVAAGSDWAANSRLRFPRVTMCDLQVRRLGTVHRYTVQCVLPINLFNEKIFLFMWFWLVFVSLATAVSLLVWSIRAVFQIDRVRYVKKHLLLLKRVGGAGRRSRASSGSSISTTNNMGAGCSSAVMSGKSEDAEKKRVKRFVEDYLRQDGVFILRLISHNTNTLTVTELVCSLWDNYRGKDLIDGDGVSRDLDVSGPNIRSHDV